ncbi:MAG: pyridoxine 5'-phosphate synthase, partial [Iodobacter sp.]
DWPQAEYNIEGNPTQNLMDFIRQYRPHQATFVPDSEDQFTSNEGWNLPADMDRLRPLIAECKALGVRVSLFMDPIPAMMPLVADLGADRIELYTETYAAAFGTDTEAQVLAGFTATAEAALTAGLGINAGHDLNRDNLTQFLQKVPGVQEVSIGHAFMADALELGYAATVAGYLAAIKNAAN